MKRSTRARLLLVLMLTLLPLSRSVIRAQEKPPEKETWRLALGEALRTALEHNLDLLIIRRDPKIAAFSVQFQDAAFDPAITAQANHAQAKGEPSSAFVSSSSKEDTLAVGWADRLKFGADYSINYSASRVDATNSFNFYNPSYNSGLGGTLNLPLLRGFGVETTTEFLVLAENSLEISREDMRAQAHATLKATEDAYWDLVAARQAVVVAHESLNLAHDLYTLNKKKVDVGTLAPIEITQAEAGVASREEGVIVAEAAQENAEDNLRRLMAIPKDDPAWGKQILPTDEPTFEPRSPDLEGAIGKALESRPELAGARKDVESKGLSERVAKSNLKPQLDLTATVTPSGNNLKDTIVTPGPDGIPGTADDELQPITGGFSTSVSEIPKFRNYSWNVGVLFSVPIGNRAAKATYAISSLNREKSELSLQNLEQTIRVDVRTAVRSVESGAKRVAAARSNSVLQQKTLEAEQKKFENGMSTSFEVLRIQTDLSNARFAEIQAVLDYNKALADLERAKGTLLEARGLRLEETTGN